MQQTLPHRRTEEKEINRNGNRRLKKIEVKSKQRAPVGQEREMERLKP
jgi:hypothetical protein